MSQGYRAVGWTPHKKIYDGVLAGGVVLYLALFVSIGLALDGNATVETQLIRALGTCALLLLHVILAIGPLARLDRRFLPLLYNRRHLGVTMFLVALGHAAFGIVQFHALGDVNPLVSVLVSNTRYESVSQFPFEALGLIALLILFAMAATSHDFWLANLTAPVWKSLHMLVYVAYALVVLHVALGVLQAESHPLLATLLGAGLATLATLHVIAGQRERVADRAADGSADRDAATFVEVCRLGDIRENRARIVTLAGERVAVFRYDGKVSAISNVCQHQNGPLGEGRIVDGCVTCPWHGYQYRPADGASPPPFTEKVPTFRVRLEGDRVLVDPRPLPPGTPVEPARFTEVVGAQLEDDDLDDLYVGYLPAAPPRVARFVRRVAPALVVAGAAVAALVAALQAPFDPGVFEFGNPRAANGTLIERPYPLLLEDGATRAAVLVGVGKHGAAADAAGLDGRRVELEATRIESPLGSMLELVPDSITVAPSSDTANSVDVAAPVEILGPVDVRGELVDPKCYLGVMKPGRGKPHRSCAVRCLSGGIPPHLLVTAADGEQSLLLLTTSDGSPLEPASFLDLVGEPVDARGTVERRAGVLVLRLDDGGLQRAGGA